MKYYQMSPPSGIAQFDAEWPDPNLVASLKHDRDDPIEWPAVPPIAKCVYEGRMPNVTDLIDGVFCVSDRVRQDMGQEAFGSRVLWYPIVLQKDNQKHLFWALFFPKVPCFDDKYSIRHSNGLIIVAVYDPSRIPSDVPCLRPSETPPSQFMREDLVKEFKKRKYIGPKFSTILLSGDQDLPKPSDFNLNY